jgi:hypothetical protein
MKTVACLMMMLLLSVALLAQEKNPVTAAAREISSSRAENLVAAAEEMPADKYDYRPTPAQMTFGHMVMHTAKANYFLCSKISGTEAPKSDIKDTDPKDKLVTALKDSVSYCDTALTKTNDSHLDEQLTLFGEHKMSRAGALIELCSDLADHYAAAAIYLRLNGLLPPTAKKKE